MQPIKDKDWVSVRMANVQAIRAQRRQERLSQRQQGSRALLGDPIHQEGWLFGSFAHGDWDAYCDIDLLAVAPDQAAAVALADRLRGAGLGDDVIALISSRWQHHQAGG
jgi:hypothetical protein